MIADTNLNIGDCRICNNTLYQITQPIAQGASLIVGTNVASTRVIAPGVKWQNFYTTTDFTINVAVTFYGVIVTINESTQKTLSEKGWTAIDTLPPIARPYRLLYFSLFTPDTAIAYGTLQFQTNGLFRYQTKAVTNQWLQSSITYVK